MQCIRKRHSRLYSASSCQTGCGNVLSCGGCYLNSSRSEGFCYATIEAVYCGAQVIQTDILGNRLDVPETLVYEVGNVAQLEDRIIQLYEAIQNPTPAVKERQKKYVLEKYGIDTWVSQEVEALNSLF